MYLSGTGFSKMIISRFIPVLLRLRSKETIQIRRNDRQTFSLTGFVQFWRQTRVILLVFD